MKQAYFKHPTIANCHVPAPVMRQCGTLIADLLDRKEVPFAMAYHVCGIMKFTQQIADEFLKEAIARQYPDDETYFLESIKAHAGLAGVQPLAGEWTLVFVSEEYGKEEVPAPDVFHKDILSFEGLNSLARFLLYSFKDQLISLNQGDLVEAMDEKRCEERLAPPTKKLLGLE